MSPMGRLLRAARRRARTTAYLRKWVVLGAVIGLIAGIGAAALLLGARARPRISCSASLAGFTPATPVGEGGEPITDALAPVGAADRRGAGRPRLRAHRLPLRAGGRGPRHRCRDRGLPPRARARCAAASRSSSSSRRRSRSAPAGRAAARGRPRRSAPDSARTSPASSTSTRATRGSPWRRGMARRHRRDLPRPARRRGPGGRDPVSRGRRGGRARPVLRGVGRRLLGLRRVRRLRADLRAAAGRRLRRIRGSSSTTRSSASPPGSSAACTSAAFYGVTDAFARWRIPREVKPAIAGVAVGGIGIVIPGVLGTGYGWVQAGLDRTTLLGAAAVDRPRAAVREDPGDVAVDRLRRLRRHLRAGHGHRRAARGRRSGACSSRSRPACPPIRRRS